MLVQCPECNTKYNLDESKIGHDGNKVRCSRCKNVFTVFRPVSQEAVTPSVPDLATGAEEELGLGGAFAAGIQSGKGEQAAAADSFEDDLEAMFRETKAAPQAKKVADVDGFEDDLAAMLEEKRLKTPPPAAGDDDGLSALLDNPKPKPASKPSVDKEMLADLEGAFQQPLTGPSSDDSFGSGGPASEKSKKSGKTGIFVGLLVLLLACALGGVYFLKPGLLGLGPAAPGTPAATPDTVPGEGAAQIALENVRQYFVPNEKEGQLFIIEGKAVNRFPDARELIRIKASLFDSQGKEVAMQEFMCGNVVSLYQLQVSTRADIEAALTAKVGILTNNTNIQPGASVPFMAVFFQTPDSVEEFGLEVIQSTVPQQ
jgi:predicted Zn finger-like uncharacterized protein